MTEQSRVDELAARIDDGQPIDWDREMQQAGDPEARRLVEGLKTLADVADLLRNPERLENSRPAEKGTPWGDLTVFEAVGRGAFGTVHRALDPLNRIVALKLLDPGVDLVHLKGRILEEGRLLARVRHPNIVGVFGAGESDGRVGLWMEFVDGWTLAAEIDAHGPMSPEDATTIGRKLCGTLVAIHAEGYVHADLKAHNVMRERGGRIVLMDFGAGQALVDADARRLAGTPLYLSPERMLGAAPSPSCDIYALGVLLYFLVTATYPVDGETREEIEAAHRDGRYVRLRDRRPDLPDAFVAAVEDALARTPAARHATAGAFDAALARVVASNPGPASSAAAATVALDPVRERAPEPRPTPRHRWLVPALAAAVVAVSAVGIVRYATDGTREVAPPPHVPPVAAAAPASDYDIHAAFYRVEPGGRQLKTSGQRIARGDVLELDLRLSHDASVYVVNEDDRGSVSLLFPLADGVLRNPLRGGQTYTLPGPDSTRPVQWLIDSDGVREHFYVIVSPADDPEIRAAIDRLTPASDNPAPPLNARAEPTAGGLRGASRLSHLPTPRQDRDAPWRKLAKPLTGGDERGRGLWIRELTLENPPARR